MTDHLTVLIEELGFKTGTPEFVELYEASMEEAKYIGTHSGNVDRDIRSSHKAARVSSFHDIRRSRTARERTMIQARRVLFQRTLTGLINSLKAKKLSENQFRTMAKEELRKAYISNFVHGLKTGPHVYSHNIDSLDLSEEDQRWIRSALNHELRYFNGFLDDIVRGISVTEQTSRIKAYANASNAVFDAGRVLALPENVLIDWVLDSGNPCRGCVTLKQLSPFPKAMLPTTPKSGATTCYGNCYCLLRIREALPHEVKAAQDRLGSVDGILNHLTRLKRKR